MPLDTFASSTFASFSYLALGNANLHPNLLAPHSSPAWSQPHPESTLRCKFPPNGDILYRDDYQILYHVTWETVGELLDITTATYQPRCWDRPTTARKIGKIIYRTGIITTKRQVIKFTDTGYTIAAEGFEQIIGEYQDSFLCGRQPQDPFCLHFDNGVTDSVELPVTIGPAWTDPDTSSPINWTDVGDPDSPNQLTWADIWS